MVKGAEGKLDFWQKFKFFLFRKTDKLRFFVENEHIKVWL